MSMRYWKVTLGVYSPTFIGSGTTYKKDSYIYDRQNNKVYFLDEGKWAVFLGQHGLIDDFAQALTRELQRFDLFRYLGNQSQLRRTYGSVWNVIHAMQDDGVIRAEEEYYAADRNGRLNDIAGFIRDSEGNPYVPGSSLKGAFRTAILTSVIRKNQRLYQSDWMNLKQAAGKKGEMGRVMDALEKKLAIPLNQEGKRDMVDSYFRGLTVSDAIWEEGNLCVAAKCDFSVDADDTHQVALFRECLDYDTKLTFTLGIDDDPRAMGHFGIRDFQSLLRVLRDFVDFQYEILAHPFAQNAESDAERALRDIKNHQYADLLLGGGTGFLSKTLVYALAPRREDAVYVTRKLMEASFRNGKHFRDKVISPHTLKLVCADGNCYLMGLCYLEGEEIRC